MLYAGVFARYHNGTTHTPVYTHPRTSSGNAAQLRRCRALSQRLSTRRIGIPVWRDEGFARPNEWKHNYLKHIVTRLGDGLAPTWA
jgi:hypothetical protein